MNAMYGDHRQKDFFWGAVVGGTLAALTAILFNSKKGQQFQRHLCNVCQEMEDTVKDTFSESKEKLEEVGDHLKKGTKAKDDHHKESK
jgi:gas vesicle protein